jgi:hypothetical protein
VPKREVSRGCKNLHWLSLTVGMHLSQVQPGGGSCSSPLRATMPKSDRVAVGWSAQWQETQRPIGLRRDDEPASSIASGIRGMEEDEGEGGGDRVREDD